MLREITFRRFRVPVLTTLVGTATMVGCGTPDREAATLGRVVEPLAVSAKVIGTDPPVPEQYSTGAYLGVASDGTNNLVVFYDGGRIRGVRYDESGTVLDLDGWLRLGRNLEGENTASEAYTDVAYGGGVFMVVYADGSDTDGGLYAQGVKTDGTLVGAPVLVGKDAYYGAVVYNGTDFTVSWSGGDLGLARVALDATVVADSVTSVTTGSTTNRPVMAMAGDVGLVVFEQEVDGVRRVYAARFSAAGQVLDPGGVLISKETTSSVDVSVTAGESEFFAVWTDTSGSRVLASRIGFDGEVLASELPISRSPATARAGAVAYDGSNYLVVWSDDRDTDATLYGTRVKADGSPVDAADVALGTGTRAYQSWDVDLTWANGRYSLAYAGEGVLGRFIGSDLTVLEPGVLELTPLPNAQLLSSAAWDGTQYVLGYSDERNEDGDQLRSVRIDDAGNILTPEGIEVSPATHSVGSLNVASNGQTTLYTWWSWHNGGEGYKRTLNASGGLSEPELWLSEAGGSSGAVSNGESFMAAYSAGDNGNGNDNEIWIQRFDATGTVDGDAIKLVSISRPRWLMEPLGSDYLLAYSGQEIGGTPITGSVLMVSASGTVTAEFEPVVEDTLSATAAGNGQQMLFSWQDAETEGLMGRLLDRTEGWSEPFVLADPVAEGAPAIGWDGTAFVVVWSEERSMMWARSVSPAGLLSDPERLFAGDYGYMHLTPGASGQMLLSYVRWLEWSRSRRVESRLVGELGDGIEAQTPEPETDAGAEPEQGTGGTGAAAAGEGGAQDRTSTGGKGGGAAATGESDAQGQTSTGGAPGSTRDAGSTSSPTTGGSASGSTETTAQSDAGPGTTAATGGATTAASRKSSDDGGCSVSGTGARGSGLGWVAALVGAVVLRRRRPGRTLSGSCFCRRK